MAGVFIAVEGPDGAGKTTLAARLAQRLKDAGADVLEVREPGGTPAAEAARRIVLDPNVEVTPLAELFLMLAARADLVARVIRPALAAGRVVLTDRYDLSTEAYQVAGRGLPRAAVLDANRLATGALKPDVTIVLDVPEEIGRERLRTHGKAPDRLEQDGTGLQARVGKAFGAATGPSIVHIDATGSAGEVEEKALAALRSRLPETFPVAKG